MLSSLRITNLALVEDLALELGAGFTVLTGETGAGKSLLVDALALLLGERADADLVRQGAARTVVEAFELSNDSTLTRVARGEVGTLAESESLGIGIRVIADGAWGFAATQANPHNDFDGGHKDWNVIFPGVDRPTPTIYWELCREGVDDCRYLATLQQQIRQAKERGQLGAAQLARSDTTQVAGVGSPAYMSPEQIRGGEEIDFRSDMFSLGGVMYHMLTGRRPFVAADLGNFFGGGFSSWLIRRGAPSSSIRSAQARSPRRA